MPTNYQSPFATSFKSAIKRGTPCGVVVENIAKRNNKTPKTVFESLFKANLCFRQKINGQWVYWPVEAPEKANTTAVKNCQTQMWQNFVDWCVTTGVCTPQQLKNCCGSQTSFMKACNKYFAKQAGGTTTTKTTGKKRTGAKTTRGTSKTYAFNKKGTTTRKYSRAA